MRARVVAVGALIGCAALACETYGEDAPSAGNDASAGDASTSSDAETADSATGDANDASTAPRFCDGTDASFCEDFESPPRQHADWTTGPNLNSLGGTIDIAQRLENATNGLRVTLPSTSADAAGRVTREYRKSGLGPVHIEADVHVLAPSFTNRLVVLAVYFGDMSMSTDRLTVELDVRPPNAAGLTLTRGPNVTAFPNTQPFVIGAVQRVSLDVDVFGTGEGSIAFRIADAPPGVEVVSRLSTPTGDLRVLLGLHRYPPNTGAPSMTAYYDDVTFTLR